MNKTSRKLKLTIFIVLTTLAVIAVIVGLMVAFPSLLEPILGSTANSVNQQVNKELTQTPTPIPTSQNAGAQASQSDAEENLFIEAEPGEIAIGGNFDHLKVFNTYTNNFAQLPVNLDKVDYPDGLVSADNLVFSPDGSLLMFQFNQTHFAIYNFKNEKVVDALEVGYNANTKVSSFSPNGKYFVIDSGKTSGERDKKILGVDGYDYGDFTGQSFLWNPESSGLVMQSGEVTLRIIPADPPPTNNSLKLIYISSEKTVQTTLLEADYQFSYTPLEWKDNDNLIYKQLEFPRPFPDNPSAEDLTNPDVYEPFVEMLADPEVSYWQINVITKTKVELPTYEAAPSDSETSSYSVKREWKTWAEEGNIYISRSNGTTKHEISKGLSSAWRPVPLDTDNKAKSNQ